MADTKILPEGEVPKGFDDPQLQIKCPSCGGTNRYDPVKGVLVCEYCGTETAILAEKENKNQEETGEPESVNLEGFDFQSLNDQATDLNATSLPVYKCVSCGSEVIASAEQIALACPYCRNNIVLTDKVSGKLRPDAVVPFRISTKQLPEAMNRFYKGKVLLPKGFFSESTMENVTGVYVPYWIFNGKAGGSLTYSADASFSSRDGDYETTETKHYTLDRDVSMSFENLPVSATSKVPNELMDSLEPFDLSEAKPFDMRYLAGFTADRFDMEKKDIAGRAEEMMNATALKAARIGASQGYDSVSLEDGTLKMDLDAKYMLLPVYLFDLAFRNKTYSFAVNGQSGKVTGNIPTDGKVALRYFLVRMLIILAIVLGFFFVKYMAGG